jgi:predicted enzyme related to lactoylglutathione lyase
MVTEIAFTAYPCRNVESTRHWYEEMLGLKFAGPYEEGGIEKYNEAHIGPGCFSLISDEWVDGLAGTGTGVTFEVKDLHDTVSTLREKGVDVTDPFEGPRCKQATIRDPEGNRITLHQRTLSVWLDNLCRSAVRARILVRRARRRGNPVSVA